MNQVFMTGAHETDKTAVIMKPTVNYPCATALVANIPELSGATLTPTLFIVETSGSLFVSAIDYR